MNITKDIKYIGVNDHKIDLFEGQYIVPNGMAYNSYAIIDEKIAIMDSVDAAFTQEWLANIQKALGWIIWRMCWRAESPTIWWCSTWSPTTRQTLQISCLLIQRQWLLHRQRHLL